MMGGTGFGMGGWWMIFPIMGFFIMIFFISMMFRRGGFWSDRDEFRMWPDEGQDSESAVDILKKRYAKGEISKEEYEEMKNIL